MTNTDQIQTLANLIAQQAHTRRESAETAVKREAGILSAARQQQLIEAVNDACLLKHRDRVLQGRAHKIVTCRGAYVGTTGASRPLMPWNPENEDDGTKPLDIDPEDIHAVDKDGEPLYPEIQWARNAGEIKRALLLKESAIDG